MSYIPSNQPNPYQPPMPTGGPQQGYPQPVVYRPGQPQVGGVMPPDSYRPGMPPTAPGRPQAGMPGSPGQNTQAPVEYVSKKDVAFGLLGAVGGFFGAGLIGLSGPVGAIILGIALLAMSSITRAVSRNKAAKQQPPQQQPGQMPAPPVYPQRQQQMYQNQYNYQMDPNQQQDPRYRQPGQY